MVNMYRQGIQNSLKDLQIFFFPSGKLECNQPQNVKWENVDDTPLGNIETD